MKKIDKSDQHYRPNGEVQGDMRPLPSAGTGTGKTAHGMVSHGKSTSRDATNAMGSIKSATKSDPWGQCMPSKNNG